MRETFEAEKDSTRKFRDLFDKKLKDEIANSMHEVEKHIDRQLLIINNELAVMNAFVGSQSLENRKFPAHTNVQIQTNYLHHIEHTKY